MMRQLTRLAIIFKLHSTCTPPCSSSSHVLHQPPTVAYTCIMLLTWMMLAAAASASPWSSVKLAALKAGR